VSRILAYAGEALRAIWLNRTRSILTMLGMIIGTSSVIAVLGISHAASSGISTQFSSFGVLPQQVSVDEDQDDPANAAIQYRDVATVRELAGDAVSIAEPVYQNNYTLSANRIHETESVASGSGYHPDTVALREGRRLTDTDEQSGAHVCLLSSDVADKFFPNQSATGQFIDINGTRFEIVGVYGDVLKGQLFTGAASGFAQIPYSTFHHMQPGPVDGIQYYPKDADHTDAANAAVIAALQHIHGARAKYQTQDAGAFVNGFEKVLGIIAAGLTGIGGVALVVAGIGIMNIMLVSVTERTREIGIRKAIGASRRDIALQFLMEALLLALGGGATGMLLGILATVGTASIISRTLGEAIIPYVLIVSVALGFSISVGMAFGMYPALRAARMDPIEALRS